MSSNWYLVLIKCRRDPKFVPLLLALARIAICFWPQTGYLHPDEFFQSSDIVGGRYFDSKIQRVWEFTTDKPIRSMLIADLLNSLAFKTVQLVQTKPSAYSLLVAPRLVYTIASFIVDISLYRLCRYYSSRGQWYLPVSIIFQSSFICLTCLTRTLSNAIEAIIFSLLLVVVCRLIKPRFRVLFVTPTRSTPANELVRKSTQLWSSISFGLLVTLGTFNRPTFPCFALVPSVYWLLESYKRNSNDIRLTIQRVLLPTSISALATFSLVSTFDTFYYKGIEPIKEVYGAFTELNLSRAADCLLANWIVTPYNFIKYNTNTDNLEKHGLHSPYFHMLVNIPFAFNVLGLLFYIKIINLMVGAGIYRLLFHVHRISALMILSAVSATIILSFIPHQEFRFLLPLIVPLAYVFAVDIYSNTKLLLAWLLINGSVLYFYATIHQAGVMRASLELAPILKSAQEESRSGLDRVDVLAFRCYLVPSYQWNIPADDQRFGFDLGDTMDELDDSFREKFLSLTSVRNSNYESQRIFILLPSQYEGKLKTFIRENYSKNLTEPKSLNFFWPHFSGEDLALGWQEVRRSGFDGWRKAFGFSLLETNLMAARSSVENCEPQSE